MKTTVEPLFDKILVIRDAKETKTAGGLIIPDTSKTKPNSGVIFAVGEGRKDEPMILKKGDKILFPQHAGEPIQIDNKEYLLMPQAQVACRIS